MLHTGFDAVADTLELQCIQHTFPKMFDVLEGFGLPYNKIGATMVAWTQEQVLVLFHVEFRYVLIYILMVLLRMRIYWNYLNKYLYILIYFFAFFDSLYIILNIAASAEKSTVTYVVTASGK